MTAVESVTSTTTYERRRAVAEDADERQTRIVADARTGFSIDWSDALSVDASEPVRAIERRIMDQLRAPAFGRAVAVLGVNGKLLSTYVQRKHDVIAGERGDATLVPLQFAEANLAEPEDVVEYWRRLLSLTDRQTEEVRRWLAGFTREQQAIRGAVLDELTRQLAELYAEAIRGEMGVQGFLQRARETMPDRSAALLENEYRTHLSRVYGEDQHQQIVSRSNTFPFSQFMNPKDSRSTWNICLPMAKAGPNRTGFICASTDPLVRKWRCPNHYQCRSMWSALGYRECQRLGILAADGRTKIAVSGNNPDRPFGPPPDFAQNPNPPHEVRPVEPAEGFGG